MDKNKNQELGNPNKEVGRPNKEDYKERIRKNEPVMDNNPSGKDKSSDASQEKSSAQQAGEWRRPLTNQDESKQPTNAGDSDEKPVGDEESEGDKRIEPYKNIGDDSEEVQKKTPSME